MNKKGGGMRNGLYYVLVILAMIMVGSFIFGNNSSQSPDIEYSTFKEQLDKGEIKTMTIQPTNGVFKIVGGVQKRTKNRK